eukprot:XP_001697683.1 predicted protein [Chlamydomonas reinhardtii]
MHACAGLRRLTCEAGAPWAQARGFRAGALLSEVRVGCACAHAVLICVLVVEDVASDPNPSSTHMPACPPKPNNTCCFPASLSPPPPILPFRSPPPPGPSRTRRRRTRRPSRRSASLRTSGGVLTGA